jgi:YidC/Oxa1 family membrane protein insertase
MFDTLIAKPIFNLLTLIYGLIPGHSLGVSIIIFTIVIRLFLWPVVKKQLHSAKKMRALQPELKRIKKEAAGDKATESRLTMELYKERGINPFSSIGTALLQLPILLSLFSGITKILNDNSAIVTNSYTFVQNLPWMKELAADISKLDMTLFGLVDLTRKPLGDSVYVPALIIVFLSAVVQFLASKMLMMVDKDARSLKQILKEASSGKEADQAEVSAATMKYMMYVFPVIIFVTSLNFAAAIGLYWLVSGAVQYIQQRIILAGDVDELKVLATTPSGEVKEADVLPPKKQKALPGKKSSKKRRR